MSYPTKISAGLATVALALGVAGCQTGGYESESQISEARRDSAAVAAGIGSSVTVMQEEGKVVYWVLPGARELDPAVFGTPENPKMTFKPVLQEAQSLADAGKIPPSVPSLLKDLPILVGVPMEARETNEAGNWVLKQPNPFSDQARIVSGAFEATYHDRVQMDAPGPPGKTEDSASMEATFTDPAGNEYRAVLDHVVKPPFPGYETDGGVLLDGAHHGDTGTGSPLMPEVETIAALWGIGDLYINGELAEPKRVMHMMTTEVVRNSDYELVFERDLPLPPAKRQIADQEHHTHLVILPVTPEPGKGPVFKPLKTAFELPNGKPQPFIHVMYEQDTVVEGGGRYASR